MKFIKRVISDSGLNEKMVELLEYEFVDRKPTKIYVLDTDEEYLSIPWWRSHPIHKNRATESIWTEPCNPLLRAAKSTKRATFNL